MQITFKNIMLSVGIDELTLGQAQNPLAAALMAALGDYKHTHVEVHHCDGHDVDDNQQGEAAPEGNGTTEADVQSGATQTADTEQTQTYPEITRDNILAFLNSDPRYTQRTEHAIGKHFGAVEGAAGAKYLTELLREMEDDGDLNTKTRRRDGEVLYGAA